jgi:hypothetical protein
MKKNKYKRTFTEWICDTCSAIWDFIYTIIVGVAVLLLVTIGSIYAAQFFNNM